MRTGVLKDGQNLHKFREIHRGESARQPAQRAFYPMQIHCEMRGVQRAAIERDVVRGFLIVLKN
jgi:hypothetical protein